MEDKSCYIEIFVDNKKIQNLKVKEEYEYFANEMPKGLFPSMGCRIYFVDQKTMTRCREYFETHAQGRGSYYDMLDTFHYVGFGYQDWTINKTYEEYEKMRMEVLENE